MEKLKLSQLYKLAFFLEEMMRTPLLIPFAIQMNIGMKTQGKYPKNFPEGLIVHFTAGRSKAYDTMKYCSEMGYTLLSIDKNGELLQASPLDSWGYHCGNKFHKTCIGVEICCAGKLKKQADGSFLSWFGTKIPAENVRYLPKTFQQEEGFYEVYTHQQELTLIKLIKWLHEAGNGIFSYDRVLGHDECCYLSGQPRRKNDPGGSLSMPMIEFRKMLKGEK
jgi:N-acetyl-anhydromuramyl-L-alanine amidase AmpD